MTPGCHGPSTQPDNCDLSIGTVQRSQDGCNAAVRAVISGRPGALRIALVLESMPDRPVLQLPERTIAIGPVGNAQDAVEVARARDRRQIAHRYPGHDRSDPA